MESRKMLTILVLGLVVWSAPMVYAAQYLTVNGQDVDSITLEVRQTCTVEIVSDDSTSYELYVGFVNGRVLGSFSHLQTTVAAGDLATETEYNQPTYYGYHVVADGIFRRPRPGVHFIFEYEAQQVGGTDVLLAELIKGEFVVIDSVHITVTTPPTPPEPMGTAFTYQGRLMDADNPADGLYDFEFKLYHAPNGGIQQGNTIDVNDVDVIDGQFAVELDFGSDPNIFNGDARWLEIGVRPGEFSDPCDYTTLSPLQELTPTPYSLYAKTASEVEGGIGIGGSGTANYVAKFTGPNTLGDSAIYEEVGKVGIGTTSPTQKLDVNGSVTASRYYDRNNTSYYVDPASTGTSATFNGKVGIGTANPVHKLDVIDGTMNAEGTNQYTLRVVNNGITTGAPYWAGYFQSNAEGASTSFAVYGSAQGASDKNVGGYFVASGGTENFAIWSHTGKNYFAGNVGIGTTTPGEKLHVVGNARLVGSDGIIGVQLRGDGSGDGGEIRLYDTDGTQTVKILAAMTNTTGGQIWLYKADGTPSLGLNGDVGGNSKVITDILEIRGGSDLSEQFEISSEIGKVKPGMVVCIDADNSGSLVVSKESYDRTVAGIVSGAGGIKPGMLMGQKGTEADGEHPVALTGRVYCWADASTGAIQPGDLLTTSDMAGHAMKVTDYTKAQGAILGKAMSSLEKGKGLVLVLVSLQ